MYYGLKYGAQLMKSEFKAFIHDENGDTNFISIIVILAIVLAVAAAFIAFKDDIIRWVNTELPDIFHNNTGHGDDSIVGGGKKVVVEKL